MFSIFKPYIFSLDPEVAHDLAIKSLKYNVLPKSLFTVEDEEILNTKLFGSLFSDLELVKTVQPNCLIVFAKKLPLKPHPKTKNLFLVFSELKFKFLTIIKFYMKKTHHSLLEHWMN